MQSDLISRSALIEKLKGYTNISQGYFKKPDVLFAIIEHQPTAYDVEKVVAELEDKALETLGITKAQFQMDKNEYKGYCSLSLCEVESAIRNGEKE